MLQNGAQRVACMLYIVCIILYVIALVIPYIQICYISIQNPMNYDINLYTFDDILKVLGYLLYITIFCSLYVFTDNMCTLRIAEAMEGSILHKFVNI